MPDIEIPLAASDLEIEISPPADSVGISLPGVAEPLTGAPGLDIEIGPLDLAEIPVTPESAARIMDRDITEEVEFPVPEAWDGAVVPEAVAAGPPEPPAVQPLTEISPEELPAAEEIEVPVIEGLELPEIPPIEVPMAGIGEPVEVRAEGPPIDELREVPEISEEEPEIIAAETREPVFAEAPAEPVVEAVEVTAEEPLAVEPTVIEPAVVEEPVAVPAGEELTIKVSIEVKGTKVRIARENIALDGAVELFRKIIERYEGR